MWLSLLTAEVTNYSAGSKLAFRDTKVFKIEVNLFLGFSWTCQISSIYSSEALFILSGSIIFPNSKHWNVSNLPLPLGYSVEVGPGSCIAWNIKWFQYLFYLWLFRGQSDNGLKEKEMLNWLKLSISGRKKQAGSRHSQNDLFDLQGQILSTDWIQWIPSSSELCFCVSLVCGTIPWKVWRSNPAAPPRRGGNGWASRHLAGAFFSSNTHHQYHFSSWWHSWLGTEDQSCHTRTILILLPLPWYSYTTH